MNLLAILIVLILFGVVYWAANRLMAAFGIGEPIHTIVIVLLVLLLVYWLAGQFGLVPGLRLT